MEIKFIDELNGIRALSIGLVILSHWCGFLTFGINAGDAGVTIFFVLSGFLITRILLNEKKKINLGLVTTKSYFKNFYARRFLRIFPIYYLLLFTVLIFDRISIADSFPWHFTYLSNFYFVFVLNGWQAKLAHLWSLSVEEQFYIFWPLLILFIPNKNIKDLILVAILTGILFRCATASYSEMYKYLPFGCLDGLGTGALLAYYENRVTSPQVKKLNLYLNLLICFSIVLVLLISLISNQVIKDIIERINFTLLASLLIIKISKTNSWLNKILKLRFILFIGTISYGLYLYHMFIPFYVIDKIPFMFNYLLRFTLLLGVATVSYYLIEKPFLNWKNKFR